MRQLTNFSEHAVLKVKKDKPDNQKTFSNAGKIYIGIVNKSSNIKKRVIIKSCENGSKVMRAYTIKT